MNYYSKAAAVECLGCSHSEYQRLRKLLEPSLLEAEEHGFELIYNTVSEQGECRGVVLLISEEFANESNLPEEFLVEFGKLIAQNNIESLEVGVAHMADRIVPGSHGGCRFYIGVDGALFYPREINKETAHAVWSILSRIKRLPACTERQVLIFNIFMKSITPK